MANIRPQLPAVPKTGDTQTRLFLNAVANILRELTRPNTQASTTVQTTTSTGTQSVTGLSKASLGLGNVDNTADKDKPVSTPIQNALNLKLDKQDFTNYQDNLNFVGQWDVAEQSLEDIGAENGNTYEITGAGTYAGEALREGDYVKFFINEDDELDVIIYINGNYKADKTTTITAGNGLTGGGDLSTNRTIALAAPGTVSSTSANAVTADGHTHALDDTGVVPGTYTKFVTDIKGRILLGSNLAAADIPNLSWAKITTGKPTTLTGYGITDAVNTAQVGVANGVASLGNDGKVPTAQLPLSSGTSTDIFGVGMGFQVGKQINEMWYDTCLNTASILTYQMPAANWGITFPVFFRENLTISEIGFYVNTGVTGSNTQIGIYSAHPTHGYPYQKLYGSSNITTGSAGAKSQTITGKFTFTKNKVYWIKLYTTHTITVTCSNGVYHPVIGASIFGNNINGTRANGFEQIGAIAAITPYFSLDGSGDGNSEVPLSLATASFSKLTAIPVIAFRAAAP